MSDGAEQGLDERGQVIGGQLAQREGCSGGGFAAAGGFHEAIGDALALSVTPAYLKQIALIDEVPSDDKGLINLQMQDALDKIGFLPFGKLIDQWRWDVFSGKTAPEQYNAAWWALRAKYQGIAPAGERPDPELFDAGAKYHVPANVPYTRYFLARILQFQFHKALCQAAGHTGAKKWCSTSWLPTGNQCGVFKKPPTRLSTASTTRGTVIGHGDSCGVWPWP